MPISKIPGAGLDTGSGGVAPGNLTTGGPYWDGSGNVGIGTTSPSDKLTVAGYAKIGTGSTTPSLLTLYPSASAKGWQISANNYVASALEFTCATANGGTTFSTPSMLMDSSGRLLVGTTSAPGQTGGVIVANNELFVYNIPTTASGANCNISSGESNRFYRSTSALKYKQDIRDIESIDIGKFRPVRYKSKCENDDQTKDHFGIIADEVAAEGFEELVTRGADGEIEGFQYDRLTVVLLKTVQEQQQMIETLQAKVAALEAK